MIYQDNHVTVYNKSCFDMSEIKDNSIQCVVTSPPYWGLRNYKVPNLIFGGDANCEHEWTDAPPRRIRKTGDIKDLNSKEATNRGNLGIALPSTNICSICGAWHGSYGLEPDIGMYISHSIEVLREIRRVLRPDGVCFWNVGDSYMSHAGDRSKVGGFQSNPKADRLEAESAMSMNKKTNGILKDKDLCLIPFRMAIAAQEDGWYVRSIIIWHKTNPMPESVTDRPSRSHEYILMLTKSAKYYYDADAVREDSVDAESFTGRRKRSYSRSNYIDMANNKAVLGNDNNDRGKTYPKRNLRDVWTINTQPFKGSHFATFPEKIPEICIKATTPEYGCCAKCGKPYKRVVERKTMKIKRTDWGERAGNRTASSGTMISPPETKTVGWQPDCKCNAGVTKSIVLDPFAGSGTTGVVAKRLGRKAILYELSTEYCEMIKERVRQQAML